MNGGGVPDTLVGRECSLDLSRPRIMGILNVTPDSFSDGGLFLTPELAVRRAEEMIFEGADIIDIGGESTRPGASSIGIQEELDRVLPVVELLAAEVDVLLSVDTSKSAVAAASLDAGAHYINDISGLSFDLQMADVVAERSGGLFVMHTSGRPDVMQQRVEYDDLLVEVESVLAACCQQALEAGIPPESIAIDPGIGFGKTVEDNLRLLRHVSRFCQSGYPVLLGTSRKSFLGAVLNQPVTDKRLYGTLSTIALAVAGGVKILRVHDVAPARDAALVAWAVCQGSI